MRVGVVLPQTEIGSDPGAIRAYAQAVEALGYGHVLLGSRQQPQRLHEQVAVLVGADQGVTERVEGGRLRRARRSYAQRHAVAQLDGRLAAERQHEHARGVPSAGDS